MEQEISRNVDIQNMDPDGTQEGKNKQKLLPTPRDSHSSKGRKDQRRREIYLATYHLLRNTGHHYKGKQILGIYMVIDRKAPSR